MSSKSPSSAEEVLVTPVPIQAFADQAKRKLFTFKKKVNDMTYEIHVPQCNADEGGLSALIPHCK
jgi:hypothetical protein